MHGPEKCRKAIIKSAFLFDDAIDSLSPTDVLNAFEDDPRLVRISQNEFIGKDVTDIAALVGITKSKSKNILTDNKRRSKKIT